MLRGGCGYMGGRDSGDHGTVLGLRPFFIEKIGG
jgi:hypothetical protein